MDSPFIFTPKSGKRNAEVWHTSCYLMGAVARPLPVFLFLFLNSSGLFAQMVIDPAGMPAAFRSFKMPEGGGRLQCHIQPVRPTLNLGFRFQTGYRIELPLKQFGGESRKIGIVLRVTPQKSEREPVWLASKIRLPAAPDKKAVADWSGGYIVGEGEYRVDMLIADDHDKVCMSNWTMHARMSETVRSAVPGLPSGAVDDFSLRSSRKPSKIEDEHPHKIAILLHAASVVPFRQRIRDYDRMLLISALSSLSERLPGKIRLTLFSMDQQKELFHTDELSRKSFSQTIDTLNQLELGTVDYSTLINRTGHLNLLSRLLRREASGGGAGEDTPPDALIILGPFAHAMDKVPAEALPRAEGAPPVYYIQLRPWRIARNLGTDTLMHATKALGGKTKVVYSPEDFADAIREIERLVENRMTAASPRQVHGSSGN